MDEKQEPTLCERFFQWLGGELAKEYVPLLALVAFNLVVAGVWMPEILWRPELLRPGGNPENWRPARPMAPFHPPAAAIDVKPLAGAIQKGAAVANAAAVAGLRPFVDAAAPPRDENAAKGFAAVVAWMTGRAPAKRSPEPALDAANDVGGAFAKIVAKSFVKSDPDFGFPIRPPEFLKPAAGLAARREKIGATRRRISPPPEFTKPTVPKPPPLDPMLVEFDAERKRNGLPPLFAKPKERKGGVGP